MAVPGDAAEVRGGGLVAVDAGAEMIWPVGQVARAGAGVLVAGNAVFGAAKGLKEPSFEERVAKYAEAITAIRNDAANHDRMSM